MDEQERSVRQQPDRVGLLTFKAGFLATRNLLIEKAIGKQLMLWVASASKIDIS
jgi:hypothetical protein